MLAKIKARKNYKGGEKRKASPEPERSTATSNENKGLTDVPRKRFKVVSYADSFKWALPESRAQYVNEHMCKYIPDRDLIENVLLENPVPTNVKGAQKLDPFLSPLLNEERLDMSLEKLQQRTINVLGPLTKVWDCLDSANNCSDEEININLPEITEDLEKAILLLGQANNAIAYQRRLFVLNSITKDAKKGKIQLKEIADMLVKRRNSLVWKGIPNLSYRNSQIPIKIKGNPTSSE